MTHVIVSITLTVIILVTSTGCLSWDDGEGDDLDPYSDPDIRPRSLVVNDVDNSLYYQGTDGECKGGDGRMIGSNQSEFLASIASDSGSSDAPVRFTIGVHIEVSPYLGSTANDSFHLNTNRLRKMADIISSHNGTMTVQVQRPFTTLISDADDNILRYLVNKGCEIALHIHESYLIPDYLGMEYQGTKKGSEIAANASLETWIRAVSDLKSEVERLSGSEVTSFSGAPFYDDRYLVMAESGITVNYNFKDPTTQSMQDDRFFVVNPWRPAGSNTIDQMLQYDRNGAVVFIPSGVYPSHCSGVECVPNPYCYEGFDYVTTALNASMNEADPERINVFSAMWHPFNFQHPENDTEELEVWDNWLTEVIDPLITDGRVIWNSYVEIAEEFEAWETVHVP